MNRLYEDKEFINIEQLAEILCISKSYAYEYVRSSACPFNCLKLGKRYVIPTNNFYKWYDSLAES